MPNRWVQFVRDWAQKNNESYMCAATKPEVRDAYRAKYGVSKRVPQYKEEERMGAEDVNVAEPKKQVVPNVPNVPKRRKQDVKVGDILIYKAIKTNANYVEEFGTGRPEIPVKVVEILDEIRYRGMNGLVVQKVNPYYRLLYPTNILPDNTIIFNNVDDEKGAYDTLNVGSKSLSKPIDPKTYVFSEDTKRYIRGLTKRIESDNKKARGDNITAPPPIVRTLERRELFPKK